MNWNDRTTTKAGNWGERVARRLLEAAGYVVYSPDQFGGAHPVDFVAIHKDRLGVLVADAKAKPMRKNYPDTGIDMRHWEKYRQLGRLHNLRVYLMFVDWEMGKAYRQFLEELELRRKVNHNGREIWYPKTENGQSGEIRYFPIVAMKEVSSLTAEEQEELRRLSQRDEKYGGQQCQGSLQF